MRARLLATAVALPLLLWAIIPLVASGAPASRSELSELDRKIDRARGKIGRKRGAERTLSTEITSYSRRVNRLQGRISTLGNRQERIELGLDRKRTKLESLRGELRSERARLVRLRKRLSEARRVLRVRLVEIYKAEAPDIVTVILNSDGFADLIERAEFIKRISDHDRMIIRIVREAKADAVRAEHRLDRLERVQQRVTAQVQERRDQVASVRLALVGTRVGVSRTKAGKAAALTKVRGDRRETEENLKALEAASRRIEGQLAAAQRRNADAFSPDAGPVKRGSGRFIFPVNGPVTSPFGQRWGRLHAGIDIPAPDGTPIRAADSGKTVLVQGVGASGGYGNYTCIQHTATMSTCYAHQARLGTSQGASVRQGQVIGYVGNTGNSFGAHLHFEVRINGTPVDPLGYL